MFLLLPEELIKAISSEMDIQDVKSLRLTCKASSEMLASQVLHSITIDISQRTVDKDMDKLQCLATRPCTSATTYATHELIIKLLFPTYNPNKKTIVGENKKVLFDALSSFQNVQSVSWQPCSDDTTWAQTILVDALKALKKTRSLHVSLRHCRLPVPFHWFPDLQEISLEGTEGWCEGKHHFTGTMENLAKMVAHSPQLNSINMKHMIMFPIPLGKTQSLHQLFQYYSKDVPPLRLHRLVLDTCLVRFDDIAIHHLKYLTSLSLTNIKDTSDSTPFYSDGVNVDSEEIKAEQRRWGSSLQEIWTALIEADIFLEEIIVDFVVPALIAYLASYSGLRILNLISRASDQEISNNLAVQFYAKPLSNHVQSLRKLDISAAYEGLWCVGEHNLSLISRCVNLKHLVVSVISSQVDPAPPVGSSSSSAGLDVIRRIIDMVAISIPQLDTLNIKPAALKDDPFRPDEYCRTIVNRITTYRAPPSCRRLPLLSVGLKQFLECPIVDDGRLRYMTSPNNLDSEYDSENGSEYDSENELEYDSEYDSVSDLDFRLKYYDSDD